MHQSLPALILSVFLTSATISAAAEQPTSSLQADAYYTLERLGYAVNSLWRVEDNYYIREEAKQRILEVAQSLQGSPVTVQLLVKRVTPLEVVTEIQDAGKARFVPMHVEPPLFGNLGSRSYHYGSASTRRGNLLAKPFALRIGGEIELDLAKRLRRNDIITLVGRLEETIVKIDTEFNPYIMALVTQWRVADPQ